MKAARRPDCTAPPIPSGYKRTDAGVIPDDWGIATLRELGQCLSGGTPRKSDHRFWDGDIPWVSSKDMKVSQIGDSIDHVTELAIGNGTRLVPPGTILMVVRGMSLAHSFPVGIVTRPLAFNQDLKAFLPHPHISGEFLLRWLQANQTKILLLATEATHGTKRLPTSDLLGSRVALPGLLEQRAIAAVLSDVDELIGALDKLIAKKRAIKLATMQQLLTGKTRLPGFDGAWDVARIDEHAAIKTGSKNTQDRTDDGQYPFFVRSQQVEQINTFSYEGEAVLTAGDGVGTGKVFHYINGRFDVHQRVYRIYDFSEELDGRYFFYQFSTRFYDRIMSLTAKSSVDSVRMEMIAGMEIPLPLPQEQCAIAQVLSDMDAEIVAIEKRRDKTKAIKQGMMQQLLTGRVRLVEPGDRQEEAP